MGAYSAGGSGPVLAILAIVFGVVWICLPFAIFGTKSRLDEQTRLLRLILKELRKQPPE